MLEEEPAEAFRRRAERHVAQRHHVDPAVEIEVADQAVVIELVLNLNAAKAVGITFPGKILVRADKIID